MTASPLVERLPLTVLAGRPTRPDRSQTQKDHRNYVDGVITYDSATRRVIGTAILPETTSGKVVDRSCEYTDAGYERKPKSASPPTR
ncbi:hypothetical protein [Polymorphospora lycopeni]|uniref:Transposase n=1 Tax=Polymorphospora lycopeni TaxID=3140240 RepID=A0ABV5D2M9_9ACTN